MEQCVVYSSLSISLMLWIKVPVLPVKNEITLTGGRLSKLLIVCNVFPALVVHVGVLRIKPVILMHSDLYEMRCVLFMKTQITSKECVDVTVQIGENAKIAF